MVWQGGMSFHGGLGGVAVAMWLFARRHGVHVLAVSDRVAMVTPIGLFLGRLSNFVNAELYGRATSLPWGMVFPGSDGQPRHHGAPRGSGAGRPGPLLRRGHRGRGVLAGLRPRERSARRSQRAAARRRWRGGGMGRRLERARTPAARARANTPRATARRLRAP